MPGEQRVSRSERTRCGGSRRRGVVDDRRAAEQEHEPPVPPAVEDVAREQDPGAPRPLVRLEHPRHGQDDQEEEREGDGREQQRASGVSAAAGGAACASPFCPLPSFTRTTSVNVPRRVDLARRSGEQTAERSRRPAGRRPGYRPRVRRPPSGRAQSCGSTACLAVLPEAPSSAPEARALRCRR